MGGLGSHSIAKVTTNSSTQVILAQGLNKRQEQEEDIILVRDPDTNDLSSYCTLLLLLRLCELYCGLAITLCSIFVRHVVSFLVVSFILGDIYRQILYIIFFFM